MFVPHVSVNLCHWHEHGDRVPVLLADEISVKFSGPIIRYVFLLPMLRSDCSVNVVTKFMEKHLAEDNLPCNWQPPWCAPQTLDDLIHPKLDPGRGIAAFSCPVIATENA